MSLTKPELSKFLTELYEKTERQQRRWNNRNNDRELSTEFRKDEYFKTIDLKEDTVTSLLKVKDETPKRHRKARREVDVNRVFGLLENKRPVPPLVHSDKRRIPEDGADGPKDAPLDSDKDDPSIMKPVDPKHSEIIYKGIPNCGREHYLKVRGQIDPDEKYYYHQCSSMEYGWRLRDSYFGRHVIPTYGRNHVLTRDGMSRSGPQPDPYYNKWPKT